MRKLKERSLACIVAAALALAMVGATSVAAFANQLAPGELEAQAYKPVVYDRVYGVMGGQYALMMKSITYEIEYKGGPKTFTGIITDLVKANGNGPGAVTVHTSSIISEEVDAPGEWTNLQSRATGGEIEEGFMRVSDKSTGKMGVKTLDGADMVPCAYDSVLLVGTDFVALSIGSDTVNANFYASDGSDIGSVSFSVPGATGNLRAYAQKYGSYVTVTARTSGEPYGVTMRKEGGRYVQVPEMTAIYDPNDYGYSKELGDGFVYKGSDGMLHYLSSSGNDVPLEPAAGVSSCNVRAGLIEVVFSSSGSAGVSGSSTDTHYYSTTGRRLTNVESGTLRAALNDCYIVWDWEYTNDGPYRVYDYTETFRHSFSAEDAYGLDGVHYGAVIAKGNGQYQVSVFNSDGTLYRDLATLSNSNGHLYPITSTTDDGMQVIVGYRGAWQTASGQQAFFDADFNPTDTNPDSTATKKQFTLADGTVVNASVHSAVDPDTKKTVYVASVTDNNGNAVKRGDCTLDIAVDGDWCSGANKVKHGNADLWWGKNSAGNWGAVSSTGAVLVPFEYESYYDVGCTDTDYALVKKDGAWQFLQVSSGGSSYNPETTITDGGTGVTVEGDIIAEKTKDGNSVKLSVGQPSDDQTEPAAKTAKEQAAANGAIGVMVYDVKLDVVNAAGAVTESLTNGFNIELSFPVGAQYDGHMATITQVHDGQALPAKRVPVIGGVAKTSIDCLSQFVVAIEPTGWNRLFGPIALDTMKAIVNTGWSGQTGGVVVLTTVDGYWDALTAAGIAGLTKAPVLMSDGATLSDQTRAVIEALKPKTIIACGGTAAVTDEVAEAARAAAGSDAQLIRCWGLTATGTASDVFKKAVSEKLGTWANTAFVCTNDGYWDALAAAPVSYARAMPIFLTEGAGDISDETINAMKDGGVQGVYIVGGGAAITDDVKTKIEGADITVIDRLWGETAVETSEAVANFGLKQGMVCSMMGVATTNGYWDALAGAPLCGLNESVIVLAGDAGAHSISGFITENKAAIGSAFVFGGEAAIDPATFDALVAAIG